MPAKRLTAAQERRVRDQFIASAPLRRELVEVETQIADLMQRRADLRAEIAATDTMRMGAKLGVSHQVILTTLRPRCTDALAP